MCRWNLTQDTTQKYWRCFHHRAYTNFNSIQREEEINFLIQCFTENGFNERQLRKIAEDYQQKMTTPTLEDPTPNTNDIAIVTLP